MPIIINGNPAHGRSHRIVVSLCDFSGNWARPFADDLGYTVVHFDLKHGDDVLDFGRTIGTIAEVRASLSGRVLIPYVRGVLMAPPCTDFTVSGARWWPAKDADGRTEQSVAVVRACLRIKDACDPVWWALENPVGRLPKLVPELGAPAWYFDPYQFAGHAEDPEVDRYTKRTGIWGNVSRPCENPREPVMFEKRRADGRVVRGSWMWANLGGKSERTKELRSMTPRGFARAFAVSNP